jgi:hypothetical protein
LASQINDFGLSDSLGGFQYHLLQSARPKQSVPPKITGDKPTNAPTFASTPAPLTTRAPTNVSFPLNINPNSTMAGDITSILHLPNKSTVQVNIKAGARCPHPYLVGRLSGPALVILQWHWSQNETDNTTIMNGIYHVPTEGKYYLEIVVVFCNNFMYNYNNSVDNNVSEKEPNYSNMLNYDYNFQKDCVEDIV